MHSERWQRLQDLFHEAAQLPESERRAFLQSRCADDPSLPDEVMQLLAEDARGYSLLDENIAEIASGILGESNGASLLLKSIGPYTLLSVLGEGGMGTVYLAERTDLGSQVAIKILRDAGLSPARRSLFAAEQRTLAQLTHPLIARLYDADFSPDGSPYFVMEYVEGMPLTRWCEAHDASLEVRLQLFRSVCEAVLYAHQRAVIHRDLKPSNVLVKEDGSVRLLDFGIAKQMANLDDSVNQTMTSLRFMTPAYAAPEQLLGAQIGIQADVYSLGVILYELLAGRLPFDLSNRTPGQVERLITQQPPARPSALAAKHATSPGGRADAPRASRSDWNDLDVLCLTAMHRDLAHRYASVEALIRDIDHFLLREPLEVRPEGWRYRARKFIARNRSAVSAAGMACALIIALVIFFTVRLALARNEALEHAARAQRIQQFMTNLFQGGDAAAGPGDTLRVVTLLDRGAQEAESLRDEPAIQGDLYETLGTLYQKLGKLDAADALLRASLQVRESHNGVDSAETAKSLTAIALLRADQGRLEEAERLGRQSVEISRGHLPRERTSMAAGMVALGRVLAARGSYDEAIRTLTDATYINSQPGTMPLDLVTSLSALADAQYSAGHYVPAEALYRRVLAMDRQLHGPHHPAVANDLASLGSIQQDLGFYSAAENFDREALQITEQYYGEENPKTAGNLTMLGRALLYQKRYDDAQVALERALAIQERVFGPIHPAVADAVNELGNVASMRNDYELAGARFERVADIYRAVYGDHHYLLAIALSNLAYNDLNKKDYARAEALFRDVVRRFTETLSADNLNTGIARIKLGRTLLREQRFDEAKTETLTGYQTLMKQTNPAISFLQAARNDLVAEYQALHDPQLAAKYRTEVAAAQSSAAVSTSSQH